MTATPDVLVAARSRSLRDTARLYLDITRPRVMALVVFTGLPAVYIGNGRVPSLGEAVAVLAGTAFAGGASSAFNAWLERESDARMARTRRRPLPAAVLLPKVVLGYGALLTALSAIVLLAVSGVLAAVIALGTIVFYVGVYTAWLKPRTPQNIVIGGAAGATAPLIAAAAVDGGVSVAAWAMFATIFLWTPPHFWAVALFRREEYANAGFPMMPLVVGDQPTRWRSLAYTVATVVVSLVPVWTRDLGASYAVAALVLGVWFLVDVARSIASPDRRADRRVFRTSIAYLTLLFLAMIVDYGLRTLL